MGDRANIVIRANHPEDRHSKEAVFLYSHWGGSELPQVLRDALQHGRDRWTDPQYLARIIFDRMVGQEQGSPTGYGISTRLCDNEYDLLVLAGDRIYVLPEDEYRATGFTGLAGLASIGFEEYIDRPRTWDNLTESFVA